VASEGFARLVTVAAYWKVPPSSYLPALSGLQRFFVDEAAVWWLAEKTNQTGAGAEDGEWAGENIL